MHGDFSRPHFKSDRLYTRVTQMQGRVGLDADWNTHAQIQHDLDAQTRIDVIGECGYPIHGGGFGITDASAGGKFDLTIGKGRFYAHGLVVELAADTPYSKQPFYPGAPALQPPAGKADTTVVYLEVWERHVTGVEAPELLDAALEGRDTTGRVETVFQVKIADAVAGTTCETATLPDPGPGTGTLTTHKFTPTPPANPCQLEPQGGYTGLDNRLYRVEIHDPGNIGKATFKWSRDNGSVVYPLAKAPTQPVAGDTSMTVHVQVSPRDDVLALHKNEWVEVLDDHAEYLGKSGPVLKVLDPQPAPDGVDLVLDLSGVPLPTVPTGPHPKVRRWDGTAGVATVPAGKFALEDQIELEFGASGFRTGDYWTFTARANGNAVEEFQKALPEGVRRYQCKLAVIDWSGGAISKIHDCRKPFPPLTELPTPTAGNRGCCTITVGDGKTSKGDYDDLIVAVDKAQLSKGTVRVCVLPGEYPLADPIVITRQSKSGPLILTGCGPASRVVTKDGPAIWVRGADWVVVEKLWLRGEECAVLIEPGEAGPARRIAVRDCDLAAGSPWAVEAQADGLALRDNRCTGGIVVGQGTRDAVIAGNRVAGEALAGISLGDGLVQFTETTSLPGLERVVVRGNDVRGATLGGILSLNKLPEPNDKQEEFLPVVTDLEIVGNRVVYCGVERSEKYLWPLTGIGLTRVSRVRVEDNAIHDCGRVPGEEEPKPVHPACGIFTAEVGHIRVTGNTVTDNGVGRGAKNLSQGIQAGVVVIGAVGGTPADSAEKVTTRYDRLLTAPGLPAVEVTDNRVVCPAGPALVVTGLGPAAVSDNTLVTAAAEPWSKKWLDPLKPAGTAAIADLLILSGTAVGIDQPPEVKVWKDSLPGDNRLLFEANQVTLDHPSNNEKIPGCLLHWETDLAVANNQFLARDIPEPPWDHVRVVAEEADGKGNTVRVIGNRFTEFPVAVEKGLGPRSLHVVVGKNGRASTIVALNQATHNIIIDGAITPPPVIDPAPELHPDNQRVG